MVQKLSSFVFSALYVFKLIDYCKSSAGESIRAIHAMFNSVIVFFFFYQSFFLSVSRNKAMRWWASMIISDEIEVATIVNQRWNENLRNYSNYRIAIPIKFGNREWCDDDKGICHKAWNVQNFWSVCYFLFIYSFPSSWSWLFELTLTLKPTIWWKTRVAKNRGWMRRL